MNNRTLFIVTFCIFAFLLRGEVHAQVISNHFYDIGSDIDTSTVNPKYTGYAPYGKIFTPEGTIKVLIIYAGFTNDNGQDVPNWPASSQAPLYVNPQTGKAEDLVLDSHNRIIELAGTNNRSISSFYNDMSFGKFNVIGDVLKDPVTGLPVRINIDPTGADPNFPTPIPKSGWGEAKAIHNSFSPFLCRHLDYARC